MKRRNARDRKQRVELTTERRPPIHLDLDAFVADCAKRVNSDAYRDGWERTFGRKESE